MSVTSQPIDLRLDGRVAIVTGGSKGIGAEISRAMAAAGAGVVVSYGADADGAERTVQSIVGAGGEAVAVPADMAGGAGAEDLAEAALAHFGRVDILVNNAGLFRYQPLEEITADEVRRQFDVNVVGLLMMTRSAATRMPSGGGSVVNIGSMAADRCSPGRAIYSSSKRAVDGLTLSLAKELGPRGINVNCVKPGPVDTEGVHTEGLMGAANVARIIERTPMGRVGLPNDIAPAAVFLSSDAGRWITGALISASGGM